MMLTPQTAQQLDLLLLALEQGAFDEIIKKTEFVNALQNKDRRNEIEELISEITLLRIEVDTLKIQNMNLENDMSTVAKALKALLDGSRTFNNYSAYIDGFCSKHNAY